MAFFPHLIFIGGSGHGTVHATKSTPADPRFLLSPSSLLFPK
jgi:hypothetical protein